MAPTHTFETAPSDLEVPIVPGGFGAIEPCPDNRVVHFVKKTYPKLKYLITACHGVGFAVKAGVLDGKRVTADEALWVKSSSVGTKVNRPDKSWMGTSGRQAG